MAQVLPGAHQALPGILSPVNKQQHLTGTAARQTLTQKSGRKHSGIVEDQAVAGMQILRQIKKMPVLPGAAFFIQHQQTRGIPLFNRCLGDQLLWEIKIKITCFHTDSILFI